MKTIIILGATGSGKTLALADIAKSLAVPPLWIQKGQKLEIVVRGSKTIFVDECTKDYLEYLQENLPEDVTLYASMTPAYYYQFIEAK